MVLHGTPFRSNGQHYLQSLSKAENTFVKLPLTFLKLSLPHIIDREIMSITRYLSFQDLNVTECAYTLVFKIWGSVRYIF